MAKYRVLWHLKRNGKLYQPGQVVELTAKEAKGLHCVELLAAEEAGGKPKEPEKKEPPAGTPEQPPKTFQFRALKDFKFNKQQYKKDQVLEIDLGMAQQIGSETITMVDPEAYRKHMKEQQAANLDRQKQAGGAEGKGPKEQK